jgi:hypothetical protein
MAEALEFVDSLAKTGTATRKASMLE